jgi:hypothetical protein
MLRARSHFLVTFLTNLSVKTKLVAIQHYKWFPSCIMQYARFGTEWHLSIEATAVLIILLGF